ncbi:MAG: ATPase, partial [Lachnospiraceae bacterium]|nr:ATPase [Lachnospiraceae bacterium]
LIVGGGYHGKSTLLRAIERGVYNHIKGDGREYVITQSDATKIRAEDGRSVQGVDISQFINHLPQKKDTKCFVSENASGSTSQAANVVEAIEAGVGTLLVDEDTSATNFMIRDHRMQTLVSKEKEPITPFVEKIKALYQRQKISTILVVGGSGDYFDAADCVIMLDEYMPLDVTDLAKKIAKGDGRRITESEEFLLPRQRKILKKSFSKAGREDRVRAKGLCTVLYGRESIDLSALEQLVDPEQTSALAVLFDYAKDKILVRDECITKVADKVYQKLEEVGLEGIAPYTSYPGNLVLPRKQEFLAMINRYRGLCVQIIENE